MAVTILTTTATTIIKAALRRINSYQSGEQIAAPDLNDCLEALNDLLDSWSTDQAYVYASPESIFEFISLKYQYTIGPGGDFQVDAVTGAGVDRPLRITSAYTRFSGLDFIIDTEWDQDLYNSFLLKNQPAPWPLGCWYNPTFPLGTLNFYPAPSGGGELHLFTDQIFTQFLTPTQVVNLPRGYNRALKWALAKELCAEYGFPMSKEIEMNGSEAIATVKSLNRTPTPVSSLDPVLSRGSNADASWILTGGFVR